MTTAFLAFVAAFVAAPGRAAEAPEAIVLGAGQVEKINKKAVYFVDEQDALGVREAITASHPWQRPDSDNVTFGLASRTVWLHLILKNPAADATRANIELNPVFLERITAFDANGHKLDRTGSKAEPHRIEAFPTLTFAVDPGEHDFYIAIRSRANSFAMILRSPDEQASKDAFDLIMASALTGGLLALMLYHLFMFVTYRNRNYLLYSLFIASAALFTLSFTSYHRQLLPNTVFGFGTDFWWSAIAAEIMAFCMYLFAADLLGFFPGKANPRKWLARSLLILPFIHLFSLALIFATDNPLVLIPVRLFTILDIVLLATAGGFLWRSDKSNTIGLYYALSWLPFAGGAVMIGCWLTGAVGHHDALPWSIPIGALIQSLLLSFAASQRLKKRDRVITSFVSHEVVAELDRGEDPMLFTPRNVEKCIVFLDMHDYTKFSEANSPIECHRVLNEYFEAINKTTYANGGRVDKIIGDAMMVVFDEPASCLAAIVQLRKNLSLLNKKRVAGGGLPIKFGVGISYGTMLSANFGTNQKLDRTMVGDTVNIASRLETITRVFAVDVLCSKEFVDQHPGYEYFRPAGYVQLKGRQKKSLVYEMFEHNLPEVINWKVSTRTTILRVIELELDGRYLEAIAGLTGMIARCPPHSYKVGQIMDPTLLSMVNAIEEKMRQLGLVVPSDLKRAG